jgi:hypothetical protein
VFYFFVPFLFSFEASSLHLPCYGMEKHENKCPKQQVSFFVLSSELWSLGLRVTCQNKAVHPLSAVFPEAFRNVVLHRLWLFSINTEL